jgi:hypothetical protein
MIATIMAGGLLVVYTGVVAVRSVKHASAAENYAIAHGVSAMEAYAEATPVRFVRHTLVLLGVAILLGSGPVFCACLCINALGFAAGFLLSVWRDQVNAAV